MYFTNFALNSAIALVVVLTVNSVTSHSIGVSNFTAVDNATFEVSEETDVPSLEISGDTTHFEDPITVRVSASASTISSRRDLRNTQNSPKSTDMDTGKVLEQIMTGTESKNDIPSRLPVQKMSKVKNQTEMGSLEELLDIYSASRLASVWNRTVDLQISDQCREDITEYLRGLRRGDLWALQSEY